MVKICQQSECLYKYFLTRGNTSAVLWLQSIELLVYALSLLGLDECCRVYLKMV
jgi:hypothetical protein